MFVSDFILLYNKNFDVEMRVRKAFHTKVRNKKRARTDSKTD